MKILKKYHVMSHVGEFRKFGFDWGREPKLLGEVAKLPKDGTRTGKGVDCIAATDEIARILPLTEHPKYPLRIVEAGESTARDEIEAARKELADVKRALTESKRQQAKLEGEIEKLGERREALQAEVGELMKAAAAAERQAMAAEKRAEGNATT